MIQNLIGQAPERAWRRAIWLTLSLFVAAVSFGQGNPKAKKELRDEQWMTDMSNSGVALEWMKPNLGGPFTTERWSGANALFGPVIFGYSQGKVNARAFAFGTSIMPEAAQTLDGHRFYAGTHFPLKFATFGSFTSYNRVFRGYPTIQHTVGGYHIRKNAFTVDKCATFSITPGYTVRFPYGSLVLGYEAQLNFWNDGDYSREVRRLSLMPTFAFRFDGLYDAFRPIFKSVDATQFSYGSRSESRSWNQYNPDGRVSRITETATTYTVNSQSSKVTVADIGPYAGIGVRLSRGFGGHHYFREPGTLVGLNMLYRVNMFVTGLNIETGRIGHATIAEQRGSLANQEYYRRPNRVYADASGQISAFNVMIDAGLNFNQLLLGLMGVLINDEEHTSFVSFNAGYSMGVSALWNQQFANPALAKAYFDADAHWRTPSIYNDARLSKGGYVGAWFLSADIGNASFRTQWYRYRRAPLANGLMMSVAWRFVAK
jgi:hypothetical protein